MRATQRIAIASLMLCLSLPGHAPGAEADLPRYDLPVGRQLVYRSVTQDKPVDGDAGGSEFTNRSTSQLTVVRENADGSRRVVVRSASNFTKKSLSFNHTSPERVEFIYADVFPNGRFHPNNSLGMYNPLAGILPPLPKDAEEMSKGWVGSNEAKMETTTYTPKENVDTGADQAFVFIGVQDGTINKLYGRTSRITFRFDRGEGAIASAEGEQSQEYAFNNKGTNTMKLESAVTLPPAEAAQLADDYDRLFSAKESHGKLVAQVNETPDRAGEVIARAAGELESARDRIKTSDVKQALAKLLEGHEDYAKYAKESADRFKDVLNKPSTDWSTTDIDGKPAAMKDYRGKVVVLDFWYRGCGWCIYAMPQVQQLADDYAGKPVAVLGMNTDKKESDARFVIETLGLKYPTIKAEGIPAKYGVQGFPTLVIIDQAGVVRDVHVGYSPTLRESVAKKIDELLKEPPKATG